MMETTSGPAWMKALGAFLILSFGGMVALTVFLIGELGFAAAVLTMLPAVLVLVFGVALLTASVGVSVSERIELRFSPLWCRRIEYSAVDSVRVEGQTWYRFGGVGLRWKTNATGLILGNREALIIRTRQGYEYVVQCRDPQRVADQIREQMAQL